MAFSLSPTLPFQDSVQRGVNDQIPGDLNENSVESLQEKGLRDQLYKQFSYWLILKRWPVR